MKAPIWERQGREKPGRILYRVLLPKDRSVVWKGIKPPAWWVNAPDGNFRTFPTHAEAIAWADYHARKETP